MSEGSDLLIENEYEEFIPSAEGAKYDSQGKRRAKRGASPLVKKKLIEEH